MATKFDPAVGPMIVDDNGRLLGYQDEKGLNRYLDGRLMPDTEDGSGSPTAGSGSVAVQALSADRALAAGDLAANLVLAANRAVTLASGLGAGFNTQFSNGGTSSATITVTPGAGVTLNGASSAVTRSMAAGQTTALLPVGTNAYILPGA